MNQFFSLGITKKAKILSKLSLKRLAVLAFLYSKIEAAAT